MATPVDVKEKAYFKGEGELIVKQVRYTGTETKVISFLAGGPIGYIAFGRDKKRKTRAEGALVVTNRAIYCAGNDYPFDKILAIAKQGRIFESLIITFETGEGGEDPGKILGRGRTLEMEIKTDDCDALLRGLEKAKMANVVFYTKCKFCPAEIPVKETWCPKCGMSQV